MFKEQATKDPRELIPYTRVSDTGPVKKGDRITLSSKISADATNKDISFK